MTAPGAALALVLLEGRYAVARLDPGGALSAVVRSAEGLSVLTGEADVPAGVRAERGFRALRVAGVLPFHLVGVLAALATPLAEAGVSVFALSTFDTDYLLVREPDLARALAALRGAGHEVADARPA